MQQIAQDVDSITKCDLPDPTIKEHLKECYKSLFKHLQSTTIPMYQHAENKNLPKKLFRYRLLQQLVAIWLTHHLIVGNL